MANGPAVPGLTVAIFGASGMVGAAVLDTCLGDPSVSSVLSVGRNPSGFRHPKLREILVPDLFDLSSLSEDLVGLDACFYTLGTSIAGKSEAEYDRLTYHLTLYVANFLLEYNPGLSFTYVTGAGADETGKGRVAWARIKGRTENDLLALPFRHAGMFRLGALVPLRGHPSKTRLYRMFYAPLGPVLPVLARLFPGWITTPKILGRAMIAVAQGRSTLARLEPQDIDALGR